MFVILALGRQRYEGPTRKSVSYTVYSVKDLVSTSKVQSLIMAPESMSGQHNNCRSPLFKITAANKCQAVTFSHRNPIFSDFIMDQAKSAQESSSSPH